MFLIWKALIFIKLSSVALASSDTKQEISWPVLDDNAIRALEDLKPEKLPSEKMRFTVSRYFLWISSHVSGSSICTAMISIFLIPYVYCYYFRSVVQTHSTCRFLLLCDQERTEHRWQKADHPKFLKKTTVDEAQQFIPCRFSRWVRNALSQ